MNRIIILISYTCSGPSLLDDLKIGVIFTLCCRLGHIPIFKSIHNLAANYTFPMFPWIFFLFTMSLQCELTLSIILLLLEMQPGCPHLPRALSSLQSLL